MSSLFIYPPTSNWHTFRQNMVRSKNGSKSDYVLGVKEEIKSGRGPGRHQAKISCGAGAVPWVWSASPRVNWSRTSFYPCGRKGQLVDGGGFTLQVNWSRGSGWEFHGYRLGLYDICSLLSRLRSSLTGQLVEHLVPHCGSTGPTVTSRGSNCPTPSVGQLVEPTPMRPRSTGRAPPSRPWGQLVETSGPYLDAVALR